MEDSVNAFCPGGLIMVAGARKGPLSGLSFAAKDVFDIAGYVTGAGNPDWALSHESASKSAAVVETLLGAGASLRGKTVTDELTFSMIGANFHYGTPANPAAPGRIPGGSSSGSASAVAAGLVDFALGTDTAGSIRLPASFCGLFGLRPTHGRLSSDGVVPLSPGFDAVGWFARRASMMSRVGKVLFGDGQSDKPARLLLLHDAFALLEADVREAFDAMIPALSAFFPETIVHEIASDAGAPGSLRDWVHAFRALQGFEVWQVHGAWITKTGPTFGPAVADRFRWASSIDRESADAAAGRCDEIRTYIENLLSDGSVLCLPSAPGVPPRIAQPESVYDRMRLKALPIVCASSIAGTPQISLPMGKIRGLPLGMGFMAKRGADTMLIDLALTIEQDIPTIAVTPDLTPG